MIFASKSMQCELEAWGPIVDRLADIATARRRGTITECEYLDLRALYISIWRHTPVN